MRSPYSLALAITPVLLGLGLGLAHKSSLSKDSPPPARVPLEVQRNNALEQALELDALQAQHEFFSFQPHFALMDPFKRIAKDFRVPDNLSARVAFWFDVYTRYGKHEHVLHHARYPWVVYDVVDTSHFLLGSGPLWLRRQRGFDLVHKKKKELRYILKRLSRKKSYRRLTLAEAAVFDKLQAIPGPRKKVIRQALSHLRSQLGQKDFFIDGLEHGSKYLPAIESTFVEAGLPVELTRIPFVESSFNPNAQSKVGASGIWQIMPYTGKKFSIVNKVIDERNAPLKASQVAASILKQNYKILKSWPLAITAYNNGTRNIRQAMKKSRAKNLSQIIRRYHDGNFKFASANFYSSFLAALHAERYHYEIFRDTIFDKKPLLKKEPLKLTRRYRPRTLARLAKIELATLLEYNLDLRQAAAKNLLLPKGYVIFLPPENKIILEQKIYRGRS